MKQVVSDKYNVAWFKLADCIARGEKERALGVYRLLSHSFDDSALACQLHADILLSFADPHAEDKYKQAAALYREQGRNLQAAAIYEHLVTLQPKNISYRIIMIELYQQLGIRSKVTEYVHNVVHYLLKTDDWKRAIEMVNRFDTAGDYAFAARLHELVLFYVMSTDDVLPDTIMDHARAAIDFWHDGGDNGAIERLIEKMAALDKKMAGYVQEYWVKMQ